MVKNKTKQNKTKNKMKNIQYHTDAVDASGQTSQTASAPTPPLDTSADLMNYDNSQQLWEPGNYQVKVVDTELKANPAGTIVLTLANIDRIRSSKGEVIEPGDGRVYHIVNTNLTGKMKPKMLNDSASFVIQAFARPGVTSIQGLKENHGLLKGETALVQVVTEPAGVKSDGKHRDASSKIAKLYKKGTLPSQS
jgi:hypothetical protein